MAESDHKGQSSMATAGITHDKNLDTSIAQSKSWTDLSITTTPTFTLTQARTVDMHTLTEEELTSIDQVPNYILKTLMIANFHAREFQLKSSTSDKSRTKNYYDSDESEDDDIDEEGVNPMDALLWIFHCSDDFLRRDLAIKLSACQLSVPFLLPDPAKPSDNVTILLSALEDITKSWDEKDSALQMFATEHPFPVVSFIRIGKPTMSKSSLLNKIMSDGSRDHNFFFHRDMKGGNLKRKILDGLVELCWYLPGGTEKKSLQKEICFANLRGDAINFKKQRDLLLKISSVFCIFLPSEYPGETKKKILEEATQSTAKAIFIFNEKRKEESKIYFNDIKGKHCEKLSSITRANKRNEYDFLQRIREHIQKSVHENNSLVELESYAKEHGFRLDGKQPDSSFKKSVDTCLDIGIEKAKDLLKLQTHVPVLAELEREKYFPKRQSSKSKIDGSKRDIDEIYKAIEAEKKAQRKSFKKMDKRILEFFNYIANMNETERNYALSYLKHRLDKKSLQVMVKLRNEYHVASLNLQKKRKETQKNLEQSIKQLEQNLKQLEESISKCSFGFEHTTRELAELYQLNESQYDYAGAAAEILLSAQPLELLNGDSFYIPLKWFNAVYSKLKRKTGNAKLFVISVLGIQSSGKSTMLNKMFGLELPVSAGRCTRGAFASIIPVSDSVKSESKFDYILIIDTEGLRGSGDPLLREHDNELATFAIGVADVTIVNIFGESHNEIKEFLEIAVHAFLKLKLVKKRKTCKIVHQNVAATDAKKKLAVDRLNLKHDLDKMAKVAAIQENCEQEFQKLNDILSFDENEDVFYIPSLLQGNPPMASVNPEYGRAVQRVKENIVTLMCSKETSKLSVSDFRERVMDLWKAMLKENFIFSFRNTIEVRAYTSLDRKYFEESVIVMVTGMAEIRRNVHVALSRCTNRDERAEKWKKSKRKIHEEAEKLGKKMKTAMEEFFESSEDKATLEQWKQNIMTKITQSQENQILEVTANCSAVYRYWQDRQDIDEKKQIYRKELLVKAKTFMISAHNTDDAEKCLAAFKKEWKKWMLNVPPCQERKMDVRSEMSNVLFETIRALSAVMAGKLVKQEYSILKFKEIAPKIDIDQLKINSFSTVFTEQEKQRVLLSVNTISDQAVDNALAFAKETAKSGVRCTRNDLTKMCHKVITTIDEESEKSKMKFLDSLKCDILLHAFSQAYEIFDEMEERYLQERDIRGDLERNLRPRLEAYFQNLGKKMKKGTLAATSFVDILKESIETELNRIMGPVVAKEMLKNSEFLSKGQFHASVLIQLGNEGKFEPYIPYLENPVKFLKRKLKETIESYCLEKKSASTVLEIEAGKLKQDVFAAVSIAIEETKSGVGKLSFWIQKFVEKCSLRITKEMFAVAAIDDDLEDIEVFEVKVREKLEDFFKSLAERGVDRATMEKWNPSPDEHLFSSMFGCQSCCPFCKSLCDQTNANHDSPHSTKIHRPQGLTGYRYVKTRIPIISICTNCVSSDGRFRNSDTCWKWHPYKDFQLVNDYYKSWLIPPDSSFEASTYWQWFMATFSKELAAHYKIKGPEIPSTWKKLTFKDVEDNLRKEYNMFVNAPPDRPQRLSLFKRVINLYIPGAGCTKAE